jgi:hypothetical protein
VETESSRKPDFCKGKTPPVPSLFTGPWKGEDRKKNDRYSPYSLERNIKLNILFTYNVPLHLTFEGRGERS